MCSICEEESTHICARCTKDTCHNHLCEKCLRCSDCCECEVALTDHTALGFAAGSARAVLRAAAESAAPPICCNGGSRMTQRSDSAASGDR